MISRRVGARFNRGRIPGPRGGGAPAPTRWGVNSNAGSGSVARTSGNPTGAFTAFAFFRVNTATAGGIYETMLEVAATGSNWDAHFILEQSTSKLRWFAQNGAGSNVGDLTAGADLEWYTQAIRWNGGATDNVEICWKRKDAGAFTVVDTGLDGFALNHISALLSAVWGYQAQDIDAASLRIWGRSLNDAQLLTESQSLTPVDTTDLLDWYPLESAATAANPGPGGSGQVPLTVSGVPIDAVGPLPV